MRLQKRRRSSPDGRRSAVAGHGRLGAHGRSIAISVGRSATPPVQPPPSTIRRGESSSRRSTTPRLRVPDGHGRGRACSGSVRASWRTEPHDHALARLEAAQRPVGAARGHEDRVCRASLRNETVNIGSSSGSLNSTSRQTVQRSPWRGGQDPLAARVLAPDAPRCAPRAVAREPPSVVRQRLPEVDLAVCAGDRPRGRRSRAPGRARAASRDRRSARRRPCRGSRTGSSCPRSAAGRTCRSTSAGTTRRRPRAPRRSAARRRPPGPRPRSPAGRSSPTSSSSA